jgi:hypothetical protein
MRGLGKLFYDWTGRIQTFAPSFTKLPNPTARERPPIGDLRYVLDGDGRICWRTGKLAKYIGRFYSDLLLTLL